MESAEQAARAIERLREYRVRRKPDLSVTPMIEAIARRSTRAEKRLGQLVDLWEAGIPPEIAAHTRLKSLRGGVLHATADSAAVAYELDRLLREGLLATLRKSYNGPLSRVRVTVA